MEAGWSGVSVELDPSYKDMWAINRKNKIVFGDATKLNYKELLDEFNITVVDFLSIDIDEASLDMLKLYPFDNGYDFKVLTIEHDAYRFGEMLRKPMRDFLSAKGYILLCPDVRVQAPFEDWWVNGKYIDHATIQKYKTFKSEHGWVIVNK